MTVEYTMKKLVRCKVCGFIMEESKLGAMCPACGVPRKAFEEYIEKTAEKRLKLLHMDLHPIIVHFPQSFALLMLILLGISLIFTNSFQLMARSALPLIGLSLPIVAVLALLSGMFDGKLRFKKITTPLLRQKILAGSIFIGSSIGIAIFSNLEINSTIYIVLIVLTLICIGCSAILGKIGSTLLNAKLP
jgi:rubredoxin/uncharacterized membrane protein